MKLTLASFVLCTLGLDGVSAMPSMHSHHHLHKRNWQDVDFKALFSKGGALANANVGPGSSGTVGAPVTTPAPGSNTGSTGAATTGSTGGCETIQGSTGGPGIKDKDGFLREIFGGQTKGIDNGKNVEYIGNVGDKYGSNMGVVGEGDCAAHNYKYKVHFKSQSGAPMKVAGWNKAGPNMLPNSGQSSPPAMTFDLAAGAEKCIGFDENSQVAWCGYTNTLDTNAATGINNCIWIEGNFGDAKTGWSAYDQSQIQLKSGSGIAQTISCLSCGAGNSQVSGAGVNNYNSDAQPDGLGGNMPPGAVHLQVHLG